MLHLIYGSSGSGKTAFLTDRIRADIQNGIRCYLLVPEQQAYISERDLPLVLPQNAGLFFEITDFSGLAEDVFREYGGVTQSSVDNGMRTLLMWDTLRTLSPLLRQYQNNSTDDISFSNRMLQTMSELHSSGITGTALEEISKDLPQNSNLQKKLSDIALIDATYHDRVESLCGEDPSDKLLRMAKLLEKNAFFSHTHIYIDSFTSFTAQEYRVLKEIFRQADSVSIALCTDDLFSKLPHFASVVQTAKKLSKIAADTDIAVKKKAISQPLSAKPTVLQMLERDLWNFRFRRDKSTIPTDRSAIKLLSCANLYEESEAVALNILELVQGGTHYGDIAVILRDPEAYRGVLDAALERYGIPFFFSEKSELASKPLSRLVLSALRAISRNYQTQDIMTLAKTGLTGASFDEISMFEEYCETWHISGSRFTDEIWSMNPDGLTTERSTRAQVILESANRVRKILIDPLQKLKAEFKNSHLLSDRCYALYQYLCDLHISEQLSARAKTEIEANRRHEASETIRLYQFLENCLVSLCNALPDAELTTDEFLSALTILFSESNIGSVPNIHDCVMIGSAATLRVENVNASFLMGLCEGEFPQAVQDDGILTEADKITLEGMGLTFDRHESLRSSEELLYVYRAMTKPLKKLYLSTVRSQPDGSARTPSLAFTRVAYLFDLKIEEFDLQSIKIAIGTPSFAPSEFPLQISPNKPGMTLRLSQSKIKTFLLCPYRYYCTYQLKLRDKKDSRPNYSDDGLFLHYVFEHFLKHSVTPDGKLQVPAPDETEAIADGIIQAYLAEVCPIPLDRMDSRILHLFHRLRKLALLMLADILGELQAGKFVPYKFEQSIGGFGENSLPAVTLELKNGSLVSLSGVVDRIDLYKNEEKIYFRVVDYKSGTHRFSLEDIRSGLDIQLILYLFAILSADSNGMIPAGAQYLYASNDKGKVALQRSGFILNEEPIKQAADSTPEQIYTKKLLSQSQEEIRELTEQMKLAVTDAAERILSGEAKKTPSEDACRFCPVYAHCDKAYHK